MKRGRGKGTWYLFEARNARVAWSGISGFTTRRGVISLWSTRLRGKRIKQGQKVPGTF